MYGSFYCTRCGERLKSKQPNCGSCGQPTAPELKYDTADGRGAGGLGWARNTDDVRFAGYENSYTSVSLIWMIAIPLLINGFMFYNGTFEMNKTGFTYAAVLSAILIIPGIIFLLKRRVKVEEWEGEIVDKKAVERVRTERDEEGENIQVTYIDYELLVRNVNGSMRTHSLGSSEMLFSYYRVGDYIKCHGKPNLKGLEKYDKRFDAFTFCMKCGNSNDFRNNFCDACGSPILKGENIKS